MRSQIGRDRCGKALDGQLSQGDPLRAGLGNGCYGIERYVDSVGLLNDGGDVLLDSLLLERIDLRSFCMSTGRGDIECRCLNRPQCSAGEKDFGSLTSEDTRDRTANGAAGPVDHRNFILQ